MYKQRDIVLIPIPFTDLSSSKKRPVIIVSNDHYNKSNLDIVVVAMTSNLNFENQYSVDIEDHHLQQGKIPQKSRVRCDKIYTLSANMIVKKFAQINAETYKTVQQKIKLLMDDKQRLF